mgnify:CR=1 FL=1
MEKLEGRNCMMIQGVKEQQGGACVSKLFYDFTSKEADWIFAFVRSLTQLCPLERRFECFLVTSGISLW